MIVNPDAKTKSLAWRKKLLIVIVAFLCFCILYGFFASIGNGGHFENKEYQISMDFPSGWKIKKGSVDGNIITLAGAEIPNQNAFVYIMVTKQKDDPVLYEKMDQATVSQYIDYVCSQYGPSLVSRWPNLIYNNDAAGTFVKINGRDMVKMEASLTNSQTKGKQTIVTWYAGTNTTFYTIAGYYQFGDSSVRNSIETIINTLKIGNQ